MFKIVNSYEDVDRNMFFKLKEGSLETVFVEDQLRLEIECKYLAHICAINKWQNCSKIRFKADS